MTDLNIKHNSQQYNLNKKKITEHTSISDIIPVVIERCLWASRITGSTNLIAKIIILAPINTNSSVSISIR